MLKGEEQGDLLELCLALGSCMLTEAGAAENSEAARKRLIQTIEDGSALAKLGDMIEAQGGDRNDVYDTSRLPDSEFEVPIYSERDGYISHIDAEKVGLVSMHLGGGRENKFTEIDLAVGIVLNKKLGDHVCKGEKLADIHADDESKLVEAVKLFKTAYTFSDEPVTRPPFIRGIV